MNVFVNHKSIQVADSGSLTSLLSQLQIHEYRGIALAVNNEVIPRKNWPTHTLQDQDKITLIRASQGG